MSQILENSKKDMDKTIETLNHRFATVRAGRANPSSLDGGLSIMVLQLL